MIGKANILEDRSGREFKLVRLRWMNKEDYPELLCCEVGNAEIASYIPPEKVELCRWKMQPRHIPIERIRSAGYEIGAVSIEDTEFLKQRGIVNFADVLSDMYNVYNLAEYRDNEAAIVNGIQSVIRNMGWIVGGVD